MSWVRSSGKVTLTDENRFGLLGQGSILTLTSVSNRTSPVQRGKWVMIVLLGTPPPPPPAVIPPFKENEENGKADIRARNDGKHRKKEPCHSCHQLMDPIGLALENFDGGGRVADQGWRHADRCGQQDVRWDASSMVRSVCETRF